MNSINRLLFSIILFVFTLNSTTLFSQNVVKNDSLPSMTKAEKKAEKKKLNKEALKGNHFEITAYITWARMNSGMTMTGPNGLIGARLSLEDLLGFDKYFAIPSFNIKYSFTRRSSIYVEYYNIYRSIKKDLQKDFEFGDITVPADVGTLKLYFNTDIFSIGYMYSFINNKKANLSFFANIFVLKVGTGIDIDKENVSEKYSFTAPLPSIGYYFNYEIAKNFQFVASQSFFFLELDGFGGFINNARLSIDYKVAKWARIGFGLNYYNLEVKASSNNYNLNIEYNFSGPQLYTQFTF